MYNITNRHLPRFYVKIYSNIKKGKFAPIFDNSNIYNQKEVQKSKMAKSLLEVFGLTEINLSLNDMAFILEIF